MFIWTAFAVFRYTISFQSESHIFCHSRYIMEFIDLASTIQNDEKNNQVIQNCKLINTRHIGEDCFNKYSWIYTTASFDGFSLK